MRYALAALFTLLLLSQVQAPVNKQYARTAVVQKVSLAAKPPKPTPTEQAQPETQTQPTEETPPVVQADAPVAPAQPTTHEELMAAAGIDPADYGAVDYIVSHESSWNPDATEPTTGAHGLPQALPYSKTGCDWEDAVCQLSWANAYAVSRYGGWWNAYNYWVAHRNW